MNSLCNFTFYEFKIAVVLEIDCFFLGEFIILRNPFDFSDIKCEFLSNSTISEFNDCIFSDVALSSRRKNKCIK